MPDERNVASNSVPRDTARRERACRTQRRGDQRDCHAGPLCAPWQSGHTRASKSTCRHPCPSSGRARRRPCRVASRWLLPFVARRPRVPGSGASNSESAPLPRDTSCTPCRNAGNAGQRADSRRCDTAESRSAPAPLWKAARGTCARSGRRRDDHREWGYNWGEPSGPPSQASMRRAVGCRNHPAASCCPNYTIPTPKTPFLRVRWGVLGGVPQCVPRLRGAGAHVQPVPLP